MPVRLRKPLRIAGYSFALVTLGIVGVLGGPRLKSRWLDAPPPVQPSGEASPPLQLVAQEPETLQLAPAVAQRMQIRTASVETSTAPTRLELSGSLILDANRMTHIHPRFAGEVVEIGQLEGSKQPVDFGESVRQGQLLAVIWSRELGEKKSELVDALSQQALDREVLDRMSQSNVSGAVPERTIREAQRKVEADQVAVSRALRTLQTWRVSEEEIKAVRAEAERIRKEGDRSHEELVQEWARVDVRAPLDGVIMERNATLGDLADTSADLFVIADLSRLRVMANAYEENLAALDRLSLGQRQWSVSVPADSSIEPQRGEFDTIGPIIDPNQHTALVLGWVDNPAGRLRVGQFISASVALPPTTPEVAIPATALIEQGSRQVVFVQPDENQPRYTRRRVAVTRRLGDTVFVQSDPSTAQRAQGIQPLAAGERVVVSGAVQLTESLANLQAMAMAGQQ